MPVLFKAAIKAGEESSPHIHMKELSATMLPYNIFLIQD